MKVYRTLEEIPEIHNSVLTIGTFDGVHIGHQRIIQRLKSMSGEYSGPRILISFHPHPRMVLNPADQSIKLLTTIDERLALLEQYGLDVVVLIPFTAEFSRIPAERFVKEILMDKFHPAAIVIGYNHRFGRGREGDIQLLRKFSSSYGFKIEEISKQMLEDISISSTKIRNALMKGNVEIARQLLGHFYSISGHVVKGNQIGKSLGYPTANIEVDTAKLIPKNGVYAVRTLIDGGYQSMLNIGHRPTFGGENKTIEVHIFNFSNDLYNKKIKVEFIKMIREEDKFKDKEALKTQLDKDKKTALDILARAQ